MELLQYFAEELSIPYISAEQKVWFFRTKAGTFYRDFRLNQFIGLGWDLVSPDLICDDKMHKDTKKERVADLYPDEKRPGLILSQLDIFYNIMQIGDTVIIPSSGGKSVSIGILGDFVDAVKHKNTTKEYAQCEYCHKRSVKWIKEVDSWQDIYLFKAMRAQQTISDITEESRLVFRNLYPVYLSPESIHFTIQKATQDDLNLASNLELLSNFLCILDATADMYQIERFSHNVSMKTAVGSPGFLELIIPLIPTGLVAAYLIKAIIGKETSPDGSESTGLLAIISRINSLIDSYRNRKKTIAETKKIDAETKLVEAQTELTLAQAEKTRAETFYYSRQMDQLAVTSSGKTTEEVRLEQEQLQIPESTIITVQVEKIAASGERICIAASDTGMSFAGKKISKVS